MNWERTKISLGIIKENSRNNFVFKSTSTLDITDISPSCGGCTTVSGYKDNTLSVTYKPGKVPKHLQIKGQNYYNTTNFITITYKGGSKEVLTFTAKIVAG